MAIYQYSLELLPKEGLFHKHAQIPSHINIDRSDEEFRAYWELVGCSYQAVKARIDPLVQRASWGNSEDSFNWKTYSAQLDNDAWMRIDPRTGIIIRLSFRADLREPNLLFLKSMLALANHHNMVFMDTKCRIIEPDMAVLMEHMKRSNAYRFVINPAQFFLDLEAGRLQIE